ncbi:MAG: glycosyltransferase, partial [Planctomycetales bacterium]|nr:glycosyltransferase [Planctomycetales bacterium]NIM08018.1 glycosyltransferase [Planctomycetales bacterium]NIN07500.1 glycosyltransferase [Planctomycetales bacterium]NIN76604.1 glycosyltransferase [Planctomycetales bacterium]NIO33794.1 glycosyltransferase [Planctomycetales bacterium]
MRILQIIPSFDRAGAEKQFALLCAHLPRDQFDVHACALTRSGPYEQLLRDARIPVTVIGKRFKVDPVAFGSLQQLIARLEPDIVQTWLFAANAYGRAAAIRCGVPVVIGCEQCADPWKRWYQLAIDRSLARRTARIIVNGSGVREFYLQAGIAKDKFVLIPNGIPPHQPSPWSREELLARWKLPPHARLVATVARLWPQKRVHDVIWAAELLTVARDDVHVLIIGDGPLRARLQRFRDQVQLQQRVHFLGHRDDVPQLIEHFDVLWLASGYEGLPNILMEAMAAGVPVVATDIPGNRQLVRQGQTGYLVPVGDRAALAKFAFQIL